MFNFDVKELLSQIEATVVPELPADYRPENLEKYVAAVLGQLIVETGEGRIELFKKAVDEAKRVNDQMLEFTVYLAGITKEKFQSFPDEHKTALEKLSLQVQISTSIAHIYSFTLINVGGLS